MLGTTFRDPLPPLDWHEVRVFSEDGFAGNKARVARLSHPPDESILAYWRLHTSVMPAAHCLVWADADVDTVAVHCFQNGQDIGFCGHGLLAVAACWHRWEARWPLAVTKGGTYPTGGAAGRVWLRAPRLKHTVTALPGWRWLRATPPIGAAHAGGADGYRILEWPAAIDLRHLHVDRDAVVEHDGRALIMTQAGEGRQGDYRLRYLAPQYGNPEDPVTGSANAVLASYWSERLKTSRLLKGLQTPCLQGDEAGLVPGGVVYGRVNRNFVEISGELTPPMAL